MLSKARASMFTLGQHGFLAAEIRYWEGYNARAMACLEAFCRAVCKP